MRTTRRPARVRAAAHRTTRAAAALLTALLVVLVGDTGSQVPGGSVPGVEHVEHVQHAWSDQGQPPRLHETFGHPVHPVHAPAPPVVLPGAGAGQAHAVAAALAEPGESALRLARLAPYLGRGPPFPAGS
ncbi:hypothetical protein [Streptomyces sulphureus]|uniref:hypothetical protein n=1 Tax=Streptomyces sulphureus TaxID=47758 RepID=UPI00037DA774|nr:hypothetical protein [Streptomyces sulphureus]